MKITKQVTLYIDVPDNLSEPDSWNFMANSVAYSPPLNGWTRYAFTVDVPINEATLIPASEMKEVSMTRDDSERLTWLEDQLWNGWTLEQLGVGDEGAIYVVALGGSACVEFEAATLREAIDKAMDSND